jgi:predicted anti-sigma-YlaC factor YlaD
MLRCDELTESLTDYLEGQISLANRVEVYLHLRRCSDCRKYLGQMKDTVWLLSQLPAPPSQADVGSKLLAHFRRMHLAGPVPSRSNGGVLRLVVAD